MSTIIDILAIWPSWTAAAIGIAAEYIGSLREQLVRLSLAVDNFVEYAREKAEQR